MASERKINCEYQYSKHFETQSVIKTSTIYNAIKKSVFPSLGTHISIIIFEFLFLKCHCEMKGNAKDALELDDQLFFTKDIDRDFLYMQFGLLLHYHHSELIISFQIDMESFSLNFHYDEGLTIIFQGSILINEEVEITMSETWFQLTDNCYDDEAFHLVDTNIVYEKETLDSIAYDLKGYLTFYSINDLRKIPYC